MLEEELRKMVFSCTCIECRTKILTNKFGAEGVETYFRLVKEGKLVDKSPVWTSEGV